ncbi:hypothetical protein HAX54_008965 [Datura stramonium]|uniref:beta-ketoacyl-[acyl-carrier-protein] synthase I n=1 Tax=Datura stramonium TaxID=4076 RepID=A0ABS8RVS9_DATST|nr:hypothetical protein [Datura stramonium]
MGSALLAIDNLTNGTKLLYFNSLCNCQLLLYMQLQITLEEAMQILWQCGGTEAAVTATGVGGFIACRALSQRNDEHEKASRPWDTNRDGFVIGEGTGVLVSFLKALNMP